MKLSRLSSVFVVFIALFVFSFSAFAERGTEALRYLPVQDAGRIKPLDTLARESLELVYGSEEYRAPTGEKRPAIEIVMTWMLLPQHWDQQKIVQITHKGLKDSMNLSDQEKYFSPNELISNPRFPLIMQELQSYRSTKQKLTPYYQAAQRLESQVGMYQAIKQGQAVRVVPPPASVNGGASADGPSGRPMEPQKWTPVSELQGEMRDKFGVVVRSLIQALPVKPGEAASQAPPATAGVPPLAQAVEDFKTAARAVNPALYPSERDISIEVHEKSLHPFKITWVLYLIAALLLGMAWHLDSKIAYRAGWAAAIIAIAMHVYGFGLRVYLTGRPPVSNMYESVIWVSFGAVVFSMIFESIYRRKFVLLAGSVIGVLCLIVADLAPTILDSSLQPLEPVLRSNMWLTIHVLTITLSYSAFFLAWCVGNLGLGFILRGDRATSERVRVLVQSVYRAIQVGVVLLAAGIILGGIWADYSWGRFWGWDPKETWALIALLGYLAALHGRLVGWVQNIGLLVVSVVAFNLVIMAWYGVNYVLGAGLHSYGFGAGGIQYVGGFY
jgi:ABC-type transport system involved in cytochrome c biogenesis permease subunit